MASTSNGNLPSFPYDALGVSFSDQELRDAAYEIFVAACRIQGSKFLSPSSIRLLTSNGPSKTKDALGIRPSRSGGGSSGPKSSANSPTTVGVLMKKQMRISGITDSRVRLALDRINRSQHEKRVESMVIPLEFLRHFRDYHSDDQQEHNAWRSRCLKILEAGLIMHPLIPLDISDDAAQRLLRILHEANDRPVEAGVNSESMDVLYNAAMTFACRSSDGSASDSCHWADGYPLNLHLYQMLLQTCFDSSVGGSMIDEVDDVLELIRKTWVVLGINQALHNLCFTWILVQQFAASGQAESDLLLAADTQLSEVATDAKERKDPLYSKILSSTLSSIMGWTEKSFPCYHVTSDWSNIAIMETIVSLGVSTAAIMEDSSDVRKKRDRTEVARDRVDTYIRSSLRAVFAQRMKRASRGQNNPWLVLVTIAKDIGYLVEREKKISSVLKKWHPISAGVAAATIQSCYGDELKKILSGITELTADIAQALEAADKLVKDLELRIDAEGSVESKDDVNSLIKEMAPCESTIDLFRAWIERRIDTIKELLDQNLQQEVRDPNASMEDCAIEVIGTVNGIIDSLFHLPAPMHPVLLPDLLMGLDKGLRYYISKMNSNCGTQSTYTPPLPELTRCRVGFRFWNKKAKSPDPSKWALQVGGSTVGDNSLCLLQLCRRINSLYYIKKELENLEKKMKTFVENAAPSQAADAASGLQIGFDLSTPAAFKEGIAKLCEAAAYKAIFHDLSYVLWHSLYVGEVASSRIHHFLRELNRTLEVAVATVHQSAGNLVRSMFMKASFDGFLLVLLAGGPLRAFTCKDYQIIEEDFRSLRDLYLPYLGESVEVAARRMEDVLQLFRMDTDGLIKLLKNMIKSAYGHAPKCPIPLPQTSERWSSDDADTVLHVLCHRRDRHATKFLKKTYNLRRNM